MNTKRKIKSTQIVTICPNPIYPYPYPYPPTPYPPTPYPPQKKNSSDLGHLKKWTWSWLGGVRTPGPPGQLRPCLQTMCTRMGTGRIWSSSHQAWRTNSSKALLSKYLCHKRISILKRCFQNKRWWWWLLGTIWNFLVLSTPAWDGTGCEFDS